MIKKTLLYLSYSVLIFNLGWWGNEYYKSKLNKLPDPISYIKPKPLEKYQIENLSNALIPKVEIKLEKEIEKTDKYTSYIFSYSFDPTFSGKKEKKVTGLINLPSDKTNILEKDDSFPVIVLLRGYVDQKIYTTGTGTRRVGQYFAENGYITIAPDFLGYGESDKEAENIFESRFQTYTTALTLLESLKEKQKEIPNDKNSIYIWAHSNGGQIALTALEIKEYNFPTVLWAPVTKPFPYSILYYTDESEDRGKFIRKELAKFETDYDVDKFSLTNYTSKISAPIEIHQGTLDDAVPQLWSDSFVKIMKNLNKDISYTVHENADHNLNPHWNTAVFQSIQFFQKQQEAD